MDKRSTVPHSKSVQLPKFFKKPTNDFISRINPNTTEINVGRKLPWLKNKTKAAIMSIPPSILTNIFLN